MAKARHASVLASYDGNVIELSPYIESLSYTDNASGTLDDITIVLNDRDGGFLTGHTWQPEKEKDLDVYIYLNNWNGDGQVEVYHCGNFVIDDISFSGSPRTMTIKGVSQPASSSFKDSPVSKTWQAVTVKQIAEGIMAKYGLTSLVYNAEEIMIESIEQDEKSDSEFMAEVCKKYGLSLKVYKVGFVIFRDTVYEQNPSYAVYGKPVAESAAETATGPAADTSIGKATGPAAEIAAAAGSTDSENAVAVTDKVLIQPTVKEIEPGWSWNSTLQGTYTGATISYTNGKKGKSLTCTVGEPTRLLKIKQKAESIAEAEKIAKEKVNEENKKAVTMSITPTLFDSGLFASYCIDIYNMGRCDGKYFVDRVSVSLSSGGLKETVSLHKIFERL